MRVGPEKLRLVTIDSVSVPSGGRFGDVHWFAREAEKFGLRVAFSTMWKRFVLYTMRGRKFITQLVCQNWSTGRPLPLSDQLLWVYRHMMVRHGAQTPESIKEWIRQGERDQQADYRRELDTEQEDMEEEVMREVRHKLDPHSRPLISIPKIVRPHGVQIARN